MRIRFYCLFTTCMIVMGSALADGTPARFDHYDPVRLNEFALQKIREGDSDTATILLERAVMLAPHDARIRQNLETLSAWRSGGPTPSALAEASVTPALRQAPQSAATEEGLPPFPLWPKR